MLQINIFNAPERVKTEKTYKVYHRIGSYYDTRSSPTFTAKNDLHALAKAAKIARDKFGNEPQFDLRVVKSQGWYESDREPMHKRFYLGLDKSHEHYFELEVKP